MRTFVIFIVVLSILCNPFLGNPCLATEQGAVKETIKEIKDYQKDVKELMGEVFPDTVKSVSIKGVTTKITAIGLQIIAFAREIFLIVAMIIGIYGAIKCLFSLNNPLGRRQGLVMVIGSIAVYLFVKYAPLIYLNLTM